MDEKLLIKLKHLLALAQSDNEHEAAAAAGKAQEIMTKHQIDEAMLASMGTASLDTSGPAALDDTYLETERKPFQARRELWKGSIAYALAQANSCKTYWYGPNLRVIGTQTNAGTVRYLYVYLVREVERLAAAHKGKGRPWLNSFRIGAAHEIAGKIKKGRQLAEDSVLDSARRLAAGDPVTHGAALVRTECAITLVKNELARVDAYADKSLKLKPSRAPTISERGAYYTGRDEGGTVNLAAGKGLGSGKS